MPINVFSHYLHGFSHGVTLRGLSVLNVHYGNIWWVDSGIGNDSGAADGSVTKPFATIDYAIGRCTASNGDIILVAPGHAETVIAAGGIDADVAGISIIGLGEGRNRPTISFTTADTADIDIDGANITIRNMVFSLVGVASLAAPIDVNAADFTLQGCEFIQSDATNQCLRAVVGATAADRMRIIGNTFRSTTAGAVSAINLVGTADGTEIRGNDISGDYSTASVENATGNVLTNLIIDDNYIRNDNTGDWAIELVSACTGVISNNRVATDAIATAVDWGSCAAFKNTYFDTSDTDKNGTEIPVAVTVGGVSLGDIATGAATGAVTTTDNAMAYIKQLVTQIGVEADTDPVSEVLSGTGGITTWKAAAAAATGVSMSEVLRYVSDIQLPIRTAFAKADVTAATAWSTGNSPVTVATVTGVVMCRVFGHVTTAITSTSNTGTLALGVSDNVALWIAATTADATNFALNDVWVGPTTTTKGNLFNNTSGWALVSNDTIKVTIATNTMTAGGMTIYVEWMPVSSGATVA